MADAGGLNMDASQWVDLSVLGILVISGIFALMRGFTREVLSIGVWIGAAAITALLFPAVSPLLRKQIESPIVADGIAMAILVSLSLIIFIPLSNIWASKITSRTMTAIDSSLGFVFGLVRGVVVLGIIYLVVLMIWPDENKLPPMIKDAHSRPVLESVALQLQNMIPESMKGESLGKLAKQRSIEEAVKDVEEQSEMLNELSVPQPAITAPAEGLQQIQNELQNR